MQKQNGEFNYEEYLYEKNYSNLETCLSSDRDIVSCLSFGEYTESISCILQ